MPDKSTLKRAAADRRAGKSPSTQAGEFVRQEMHHIREGKHGAKSAKQAIAIGLSEARRAGVPLKPPKKGKASQKTRRSAQRALRAGERGTKKRKTSARRSRAVEGVLRREGRSAASHRALSRQAHRAAGKRTRSDRSAAARKASRTKGAAERSRAARKGARTRAAHRASHRA
ncbi:MAG TPA: DUF6496 domain-containing protein [Usitatibacter sp.]|nr:DUF6496 domain-containing protein [Usitatibacter sp.]